MVCEMNETEFEKLLSLYGADISVWPVDRQHKAHDFASTKVGKQLLKAEEGLVALFATTYAIGHEHIEDRNVNAFLARLSDIPKKYVQQKTRPSRLLDTFRKTLMPFEINVSPIMLMTHAAGFFIVLGMGLMVGFYGAIDSVIFNEQTIPTEIDISDTWFNTAETLSLNPENFEE